MMPRYGTMMTACLVALYGASAGAQSCLDTAAALQARYDNAAQNCNSPTAPGFLCSGVILRGTAPASRDDLFNTWDAKAPSRGDDATSYAYLRSDANFKRLKNDNQNGYVLYPIMGSGGAIKHKYEVLCGYPIEGASAGRTDQGCGIASQVADPQRGRSCHTQGIVSGPAWVTHYDQPPAGDSRNACGFALTDDLDQQGVTNFNAMLEAMRSMRSLFFRENELRIKDWDASVPVADLPIQSLFYVSGSESGLANARLEQQRYFSQSDVWLPIIAVTMPRFRSDKAGFSCHAQDQALDETTRQPINEYIESGEWIRRRDGGSEGMEWAISLKPTALGRQQNTAEGYAKMYAEVRRKYGKDYQWTQNDGGGVYRQMVCHLIFVPDKDRFNLEPFRPNVTHEESEEAQCNPVRDLWQAQTKG